MVLKGPFTLDSWLEGKEKLVNYSKVVPYVHNLIILYGVPSWFHLALSCVNRNNNVAHVVYCIDDLPAEEWSGANT